MRHFLHCFALLALVACSRQTATKSEPFDPVNFFSGHSRGEAALNKMIGGSSRIAVDSRGVPDGRGGLTLVQKIAEEGSASRVRRWVLHPAGPNRWMGSLTDAAGPVGVKRTATDVIIRYRMHNGAQVEQILQQQPDGTVENHLTVTRFGIRLASLDERIRKLNS